MNFGGCILLQLAIAALVLLDGTTAVRTVTIVHNATTCHDLETKCTTLEKCLQDISTCFSSNTLVKFQAGTYNQGRSHQNLSGQVASYPGHVGGGKSGLVSTVCACAKNPMISWGIIYHHLHS